MERLRRKAGITGAAIALLVGGGLLGRATIEGGRADVGSPTPAASSSPSPDYSPTLSPTTLPSDKPPVEEETDNVSLKVSKVQSPDNLENLKRRQISQAPLGEWFHPIYDKEVFEASNGFEGQWSWYHTLILQEENGGQFLGFENNDGRFVFRVNRPSSAASFAVLTTGEHFDQFMAGSDANHSAVNVRTLPNTVVEIYDPQTEEVVGSQRTSRGGDLTIIEPQNGMYGVRVEVEDPAATFEVQVWFGPYDRSENINTFDASNLGR